MNRILITGAGGYIGKFLAKNVGNINNLFLLYLKNQDNRSGYVCDLKKRSFLQDLDSLDVDLIIHTAAEVPLLKGKKNTIEILNNNRLIDDNVLNFAIRKNAMLVYFSTCGLYDKNSSFVHTENSQIIDNCYYKKSKKYGEQIMMDYGKAFIIRVSSPYSLTIFPDTVLSHFINQAKNKKEISVWGKGQREQDFVQLEDLLEWIKIAYSKKIYGIFNACSSFTINTFQLASHIAKKYDAKLNIMQSMDEKMQFARYDNLKIKTATGHYPKNIYMGELYA